MTRIHFLAERRLVDNRQVEFAVMSGGPGADVLSFAAFHQHPQDTMTPGTPSKLQILERLEGDVTVLVLTGELTMDDGDLAFGRYVDGLIRQGRVKIVVNLNGVTYIDSAGVGMMVAESKMVREKGGVIKLAQLTARSHHLLAMMKLKVVFEIFDDEAAALHSFTWGLRP